MSTKNRKFGCEFEFSTNFDEVAKNVKPIITKLYGKNSIKIKKEHYLSVRNKKWHLKTEATTECELTTPISTIKDLPKILKVITHLKQNNTKITSSDSIHIHMSAPDVEIKNIIVSWLFIECCILKCFNKNRQNNEFCPKLNQSKNKKTKISSVYKKALELSQDHHAIISLQYYKTRETVEFRLSQATFKASFIEGWIKFCMHYLNWAKNININEYMKKPLNKFKNPKRLIKQLNIKDTKIKNFLKIKHKPRRH